MAIWNDLPDELRLQVLGSLTHDDENRASYGSVCRQWMKIMEPYIFEEITFYVTNASILSGSHTPEKLAATVRGSRLKALKKLRLVINVDLFTFGGISNAHLQRIKIGAGFVDVMDGFVDVLRDWREEASFDLQVYDITDCGHHLLEYGSVLLSRDGQRPIECVRALRSVIHGEGSLQCDNMNSYPLRDRSGVAIPRVSHILLFNMSSNMKELSYGCRNATVRLDEMTNDVWPRGLTSLEIWNARLPFDWRNTGVGVVAPTLQRLHVNSPWADEWFHCFCRGLPHRRAPPLNWPRLKDLSWGRLYLAGDPNNELWLMALAAGGMPLLESLELWGDRGEAMLPDERSPTEAHFQCTIDEKFVTAVFKTTVAFQPSDILLNAWQEMARRRGRLLHFEVEQVGQFDYMEPFTSLEVKEFFNRRIYPPEPSQNATEMDICSPDKFLRLRAADPGPVQKKHMHPCLRCHPRDFSFRDDAWVRYLRKPQESSLSPR